MAGNLKAKFEALGTPPPPNHAKTEVEIVKEIKTPGKFHHTGNSGGGHTGYDGKYSDVERRVVGKGVKTTFNEPPPQKKSLSDLP